MPSWEPAPRPTASKLQGITSAKVQYLEICQPMFNCGVSKMSDTGCLVLWYFGTWYFCLRRWLLCQGAWYFGTWYLVLGTLV